MNRTESETQRPSQTRSAPRILVVEDDADSREALTELLQGFGYEVLTAEDGAAALRQVELEAPDLVISDVMMPRTDGFRLVARLRQAASSRYLPVILVSARNEVERRVVGLDIGADDYLTKPLDAEELLARVRVQLRRASRQKELLRRTIVDELTGVLNRRGVVDVLQREYKRADRLEGPLSILMIDVDDFKEINDTYGHAVGDAVLGHIASALTRELRGSDQVGRFGGDEFVIILPHTAAEAATLLAERLREIESVPVDLPSGEQLTVTLSVGQATCYPGSDASVGCDDLLRLADADMYRRKRASKEHRSHVRGH